MKLLSFGASNHRSIKELQTITFYSGLSASALPEVSSILHPVTVLMGANGAGKSNLLDALNFALAAIQHSATVWRDKRRQPHFPFRLDTESRELPSTYEIEFVLDGMRYAYGFEWSYQGVHKEWLSRVPNRRWTMCFEREWSHVTWNQKFMPASAVRELGKVNDTELILSVALRGEHSVLHEVAEALTDNYAYVSPRDKDQHRRVDLIVRLIREGSLKLEELSQLMQAADTGISKIDVDEKKIPPEILVQMNKVLEGLRKNSKENDGQETAKFSDEELENLVYTLRFTHQAEHGEQTLSLSEESDGTLSWLSLAPIMLDILREGAILSADELDASLHQFLMEFVIRAFLDKTINVHGAQLIFSTHNTNILEHSQALGIDPAAIWFVEKNCDGMSELFSLADFELHKNANYERRYLGGRYGAVPHTSLSTLRGLVG